MNTRKWQCFSGGKRGHWPSRREAFVSAPPATLPERIIAADIPPLAHAPARWRLFDPAPAVASGGRGLAWRCCRVSG